MNNGPGSGGSPGTGGIATGGSPGTGGATGGSPGTGGIATGGSPGTGGIATGGSPGTGGIATGGQGGAKATGGAGGHAGATVVGQGGHGGGAAGGHTGGGGSGAGGASASATFAFVSSTIMANCGGSNCHNGTQSVKFDVTDMATLYTNLTTMKAPDCKNLPLVTPGDPTMSALYLAITKMCGGTVPQMPDGKSPLPTATITAIQQWIMNNAPQS